MKFKLRRYYLYYLGRALGFLVGLIPLRVACYLAGVLGEAAFLILPKYRNATIRHLRDVFAAEKSPEEIGRIARGVFRNLAKNAVELVHMPRIDPREIDRFVTIKGIEAIDAAMAEGNGAVVVTGHFGNWELMPATLKMKGYEGAVIGRRIYFDKYDRYLNSIRASHGVQVIYRDESPRKALKVLRDNGILGIVADQDVDSVEGVFVDFFGHSAYTPAGPAALAKITGSALIPAFMIRKSSGHELIFEKPVELVETGDKDKDLVENTQRWSNVIEEYIRRYPEQWVWMHRRWKTKENTN
jgi:KDO2-lipid IV(A) lauroyltransferase